MLILPQNVEIQSSQKCPSSQCESLQHPWPSAHGPHVLPPQSTSVSSPDRTPSSHDTHFIVEKNSQLSHVPDAQSLHVLHACAAPQPGQALPPQSQPVGVNALDEHVSA